MYYDRFDIVEAHYAFACEWHGGQASELYVRQCKIRRYFKPGACWNGFESLDDNAREIYWNLCDKHKLPKPVYVKGYSYEWMGYGLEITTPFGTCFMQGEEANNLYDELEALETDKEVATMLSDYEHVCE